jgi:acetyl-CoA carboxylase beta subunit
MCSAITVSNPYANICFLDRKVIQNPIMPKIFLANAPISR